MSDFVSDCVSNRAQSGNVSQASFLLRETVQMMHNQHQQRARRRHWFAEAILDALRGLLPVESRPMPADPVWQRASEVEAFRVWQTMRGDDNPDIEIRVIRIEL